MLKIGVVLLLIASIYAGVYGLMALTAPKVVLKTSIQASIGKTIDDAQNDGYLKALTSAMRHIGVLALATVTASLFILLTAFRKAQKWAWWAFLISGGIGWLGGLIINIALGDKTNMILHLIGAVVFLVGVLLPVKEFFAKPAAEA